MDPIHILMDPVHGPGFVLSRLGQRPDGHTFLCKFWHFQMAISCLLYWVNLHKSWGFCKVWSVLYDYVDH